MKLIYLPYGLPLATLLATCVVSANDTYRCQHKTGTIQFTSEEVILKKEGPTILVYQVKDDAKLASWTYHVTVESQPYGLQAVRGFHPPKDTPIDVTTGGVLFLILGDATGFLNNTPKPFVFVVSADADSKTSSSELLTCKKAS